MEPSPGVVGSRIRAVRERAGMSRRQVALAADLPERSLIRYELGENMPGGEVVYRLARALGVTADHLLGGSEAPGDAA